MQRKRIVIRPIWLNLFFKSFWLKSKKYVVITKPTFLMKIISKYNGNLWKN